MDAAGIAALLTGGAALVGGVGTWWWNRGKQKVDRHVGTYEGLSALVDQLQEERDTAVGRADKYAAEVEVAQRERRAALVERDAAVRQASVLADENRTLVTYFIDTARGVADGTVPPWLAVPYVVRERLAEAGFPLIPPDDGEAD